MPSVGEPQSIVVKLAPLLVSNSLIQNMQVAPLWWSQDARVHMSCIYLQLI